MSTHEYIPHNHDFIVFEGCEGTGKTTQIAHIKDRILHAREAKQVWVTKEPGGSDYGQKIGSVILDRYPFSEKLNFWAEFYLFMADRAQHIPLIIEHLKKGPVLSDRFSGATMAYQGFGRRLFDHPEVKKYMYEADEHARQGWKPGLIVLLDQDVRIGLSRKKSQDEMNRLDAEDIQFHERVRAGFLQLARERAFGIEWAIVDASKDLDAVTEDIWERVYSHIHFVP